MKKSVKGLFVAAAAVAAVSLTACAPKTADKAKEKLEKKDYIVEVTSGTELELVIAFSGLNELDGLESIVTATKTVDDKLEGVVAYYFESSSDAKDAMETLEKMAEEDADEINDVKRSGKVIYAGTEQGMKDFD